jgi:cell wall-associated NlpC family hydrolase
MYLKFSPGFLLVGVLSVFLLSCSSTSQSDRYNKPKEEDDHKSPSSVRFTSKEEKEDDSTVYNNTSEEMPEFDEIPVEDHPVDTKEFVGKYERTESFNSALTPREKVMFEIISFLNTPYKYGGVDENGIDCSAFTKNVFKNSLGIELPRTASEQYQTGDRISSKDELQFGDLVFFNTTKRSYPGHVGVYIGENLFAHASRSLGVTVSSLKSSYYNNRFVGASRIK